MKIYPNSKLVVIGDSITDFGRSWLVGDETDGHWAKEVPARTRVMLIYYLYISGGAFCDPLRDAGNKKFYLTQGDC